MNLRETLGLAALRHFDPETAHTLALKALRSGLVTLPGPTTGDRLKTTLAGLSLANPVGLAAGFDKNATAVAPLSRAGFGFIELGAATPRPQPGNPKPRLFRLARDRAVINRFGFNNDGASEIAARLRAHTNTIPVGLNLGANKDSNDRAADYSSVLATTGAHIDFATVNVSSPNTASLRDLQGKAALTSLLNDVMATRNSLAKPIPVFLKIAPDLSLTQLGDIADVAQNARIDAIIATNTTLDHTHLTSTHANQTGGLSGAPLFDKSTRILAHLSHLTDGKIPLIGVGGIASGADAYAKIIAGADAVQLYTALVFQGLSLAANIARDLDDLLRRDGFSNVAQAVGTKRADWL